MTIQELFNKLGFKIICLPNPERVVLGGYTGDLLSNVLTNAKENQVLITVLGHETVLAIAEKKGLSGIILTCGASLSKKDKELSILHNINVAVTDKNSFETTILVNNILKG